MNRFLLLVALFALTVSHGSPVRAQNLPTPPQLFKQEWSKFAPSPEWDIAQRRLVKIARIRTNKGTSWLLGAGTDVSCVIEFRIVNTMGKTLCTRYHATAPELIGPGVDAFQLSGSYDENCSIHARIIDPISGKRSRGEIVIPFANAPWIRMITPLPHTGGDPTIS